MKVNAYHLEIEYHDAIGVEGVGEDSYLRIGDSVIAVDRDASRRLMGAIEELHLRLHPEEAEDPS